MSNYNLSRLSPCPRPPFALDIRASRALGLSAFHEPCPAAPPPRQFSIFNSALFLHCFRLTFRPAPFTIPSVSTTSSSPLPEWRNSAPYQYSWQTEWLPPLAKVRLPFPRPSDPPSLKPTAFARFRISAFGHHGSVPWVPPALPASAFSFPVSAFRFLLSALCFAPRQGQLSQIKPN